MYRDALFLFCGNTLEETCRGCECYRCYAKQLGDGMFFKNTVGRKSIRLSCRGYLSNVVQNSGSFRVLLRLLFLIIEI